MKWSKKETEVEDSPRQAMGVCLAYGCPMPAAISNSTSGKADNWVCHFHFRAEPHQWLDVTKNLRHETELVTLINEIRLSQNGKLFDVKGRLSGLKNSGSDAYLPNDLDRRPDGTLSMRLWLSRLEKTLFAKVTTGLEQVQASEQAYSSSSEQVMNHIDEFLKKHRVN